MIKVKSVFLIFKKVWFRIEKIPRNYVVELYANVNTNVAKYK